jgi:hypothetical protein
MSWINYSILADRFDEAASILNEADKRKFDNTELHRLRFLLAFLNNDQRAMQEQLDWAAAGPDAAPLMLYVRSRAEAYYGHFREARIMKEQAFAQGLSFPWIIADYEALPEAEVGNIISARRRAMHAVSKRLNREGKWSWRWFSREQEILSRRKNWQTRSAKVLHWIPLS